MTHTDASSQAHNSAHSLWIASCLSLVFMPFGMAIAHRSAPLFIVLSAFFALCGATCDGTLNQLLGDMRKKLTSLPGCLVLVFLSLALISLSWTWSFRGGLFSFGELLLSASAGFLITMALPQRMPRWLPVFAICILILSAIIIVIDIETDFYFRRMAGATAIIFIYNRSIITLLLTMIPLVFLLWRRQDRRLRTLAIVSVLIIIGTVFKSDSGAAKVAVLVFISVYSVARLWPKTSLWLAGSCLALIFLIAPVYGSMFDKVLPAQIIETFKSDNSHQRVKIWLGFEYVIREQPLLGGGFGVSPVIIETPAVVHVPAELRGDVNMGHPHNAAMQVWVEIGAIGALIALLALFAMLRSVANLAPPLMAQQLAWIAAVAFIAIIGHGAWQGWWLAAIGAGMTWFRAQWAEAEASDKL